MMKYIVLVALFGVASAQLKQGAGDKVVILLKSNQELNDDGSFSYGYELDDGTKVEQSGYLKNRGTEQEGIYVQGSYKYIEPQGETIGVEYTADENGFIAKGDHLPTPPPIPEEILKATALVLKNAEAQKQRQKKRASF